MLIFITNLYINNLNVAKLNIFKNCITFFIQFVSEYTVMLVAMCHVCV